MLASWLMNVIDVSSIPVYHFFGVKPGFGAHVNVDVTA
jgi:hypothetical protein